MTRSNDLLLDQSELTPGREPPNREPPNREPPGREPPNREPPSREPPSREPRYTGAMAKIKILVVRVGKDPAIEDIDDNPESFHALIGANTLERIVAHAPRYNILVDGERVEKNLPMNRLDIRGDFIITGLMVNTLDGGTRYSGLLDGDKPHESTVKGALALLQ